MRLHPLRCACRGRGRAVRRRCVAPVVAVVIGSHGGDGAAILCCSSRIAHPPPSAARCSPRPQARNTHDASNCNSRSTQRSAPHRRRRGADSDADTCTDSREAEPPRLWRSHSNARRCLLAAAQIPSPSRFLHSISLTSVCFCTPHRTATATPPSCRSAAPIIS